MVDRKARLGLVALVLSANVACFGGERNEAAPSTVAYPSEVAMDDADEGLQAEPEASFGEAARAPAAASAKSRPAMKGGRAASSEEAKLTLADIGGAAVAEEAPRTRSWFPDAFIWEPVVVTNGDGVATVPVRVPDTLTDWRVLGLAHDRSGQQAGATTGFASRLPVYADPRLPSFLYVGDELQMPVRAVNGTDGPLTARVALQASGALSGGGSATLALGPNGVGVKAMTLEATKRGLGIVQTQVQGGGYEDLAERTLTVTPTGRPVTSGARGVLAAETPLVLPALAGTTGQESIEVVVFPGPMALVQAEVDRFASGARSALPGSALQAVALLRSLSAKTGATIDPKLTRRLQLLAWQQIARQVKTAAGMDAVGILRAMSSEDLTGGAEATRPGLVRRVVADQKDDGTWSSQSRSTLQRVLVETATSAMVVRDAVPSAWIKAQGAVERQLPNIDDAYTAAVLLGTGVLEGAAAEGPRKLLVDAIQHDEQGVPSVVVPEGVVDAWGEPPSATAMLAWTVLALGEAPETADDRGKLAAELIASWSRSRGFGAGRADPIALLAVVRAVPGASGPTQVTLVSKGRTVATGQIDPRQPGVPLVLSSEDPEAVVKLDPPVSGLAYAATRRGYAPWPEQAPIPGVEWAWQESGTPLKVGEANTVELRLAGPRGVQFVVEQGIPAGMAVDAGNLTSQVAWAEVLEDRVRFRTNPLGDAGATVSLIVTPSFAGRFSTVPMQVEVPRHGTVVQPARIWTVN